ncbi:MAG: hypothetical protein Kow0065_23580 [Methylomicrobium sp.]
MKKTSFLTRLERLFDSEHKKTKHDIKELKSVLRKLKKKERELCEALALTTNPELAKLYRTELEIIRIHRKKGLAELQTIRSEQRKKS